MFLAPYSSDLNFIGKLWIYIEAEWFTDFIAKDRDALMDSIDRACHGVFARKPKLPLNAGLEILYLWCSS